MISFMKSVKKFRSVAARVVKVVKVEKEDIMEVLPVATMKVVVSVSIGVKVCTEEMTSSTMMVLASM